MLAWPSRLRRGAYVSETVGSSPTVSNYNIIIFNYIIIQLLNYSFVHLYPPDVPLFFTHAREITVRCTFTALAASDIL